MMKTVQKAALEWLHKQLKSKEMGLFRALHKVNATEEEIENLEKTIDVIRYLINLVAVDGWMDPEIELPGGLGNGCAGYMFGHGGIRTP